MSKQLKFFSFVRILLIFPILFLSLPQTTFTASEPVYQEATDLSWKPWFKIGGKLGDRRTMGQLNLFAPLWQNDRSMIFTDLRGTDTDGSAIEGNAGLGFRRMMGDNREWILGLYGFFDFLRSPNRNHFVQGVIGGEVLTENWDFRTNGYLPERDSPLVASTPVAFTPVVVGTSIFSRQGNLETREKALPGFDIEIGRKLPYIDRIPFLHPDIRMYAGYFYFNSSDVPEMDGPRFRAEWRMDDFLGLRGTRFQLDSEFQHDDVRGWEYFGGFSLRVPLEWPFGERKKQDASLRTSRSEVKQSLPASKAGQRHGLPRRLAEGESPRNDEGHDKVRNRMTEPVIRDVDVVTQAGKPTVDEIKQFDAINPATGLPYGEIHFAAEGGVGDGTLASPESLTNAITNAGTSGIVAALDSGGNFANTNATLLANQTIIGSGSALSVQTPDGLTSQFEIPGSMPTLDGGGAGDVLTLASNTTVKGLQIQNAGQDGIQATNLDNVTVINNAITANTSSGIHVNMNDGNTHSNFTFSGNTITNNNYEIYAYISNGTSVSNFMIKGNTISNGNQAGIRFYPQSGGTMSNFVIENNAINNNTSAGIAIQGVNTTLSNFTIKGNAINNNSVGFYFSNFGALTVADMVFTGNTITANTSQGILLSGGGSPDINLGNILTGEGGNNSIFGNTGLDLQNDSGTNNLEAENNFWTGGGACGAKCGGGNTSDTDPFLTTNPN